MFEPTYTHNGQQYRQLIIIGFDLWEIRRPFAWQWSRDQQGWTFAHSWVYVCPTCGELWGKAMLMSEEGELQTCIALTQPCPKHPTTRWHVAGSLLCRYGEDSLPHDPPLLEALPRELLFREFQLHEAHIERFYHD